MRKRKEHNRIGWIVILAVFLMLSMAIGVMSTNSTQRVAYAAGESIDDLTIPSDGTAVTIVSNDGTFKMPSITGLTFKYALNDKTMYTSYSASQSVTSATFDITNVAQAVASIKAFTYTSSDTTMSIDVKVTSDIALADGDVYFNGHVYRYMNNLVEYGPTNMWEEARAKAKATTAYSTSGYLTNVTTAEENTMLLSMLQTSSSSWNKAYIGARLAQTYSSKLTSLDSGKFYWADGPEQNTAIIASTNFFHEGEPNADANTLAYLYIGWEGPYWDDLANTPDKVNNREVTGYIIEFDLPSTTYSTVSKTYVIGDDDKDYQSIELTSNSFNKDVIANGATSLVDGQFNTIDHFVDGTANQYCYNTFYSSDFIYGSAIPTADTGFPSNNIIVGEYSEASYSIAPYSGNNVAYVANGSMQTLTFISSGAYSDLVFLSTRAGTLEGVSTLTVTANFSDGTNAQSSFRINNWFTSGNDNGNKVYAGYELKGRVYAGGPNVGTIDRQTAAPYLKECYMDLSAYKNKLVQSVTIQSGSDGAGCYVFAVAGKRATTLGAPVQSDISSISTIGLTANWSAVTDATSYTLDVATSESFDAASMVTGYNNKNVGDVTTTAVDGLSDGTQYYVRVRAVNADGQSFSSNVKSATTTVIPPPSAPVQTDITSVSATGLTVNWNAVTGATSYVIDVATSESFSSASMVAGYNNNNVGNVTTIAVEGLSDGTQYYVRVRAVSAAKQSLNSNVKSATTIATSATVTFNLQYTGAPSISAQDLEIGEMATEPADPTCADYIFDGWYEETECETLFDFETEITEDITLYAKWLVAYEVSFDQQYENAPAVASHKVGAGKTTVAPGISMRAGYEDDGWYLEPACTTRFDFSTTAITADITLYAKWIKDHYVLVIDAKGGEGDFSNINVEYGQSTNGLLPALTKRGYYINYWEDSCGVSRIWDNTSPDEENAIYDLGDNNEEITIWPSWCKESYDLHYNPNGGTCKNKDWVYYDTIVVLPEAVKEGSTFIGWYTKDGSVDNDWGSLFDYHIDDLGTHLATIELYARYTQASTFEITGKVVDKDNNPIDGAMVILKVGSTMYATLGTDAQGEFDIHGLTAKRYQLVIIKGDIIITKSIDLQENLADFTVTLPDAELISLVEVEEGVPEVVIDGLNEGFTDADQNTASEPGKSVELKLIVENVEEANATINSNLGGFTLGLSLDISLIKTNYSDGVVVSTDAVRTTGGLIKIIVSLPQALQGKYEYAALRENNGSVQKLTSQANADGEYIEVSSDKMELTLFVKNFSQYAISYKGAPSVPPPATTDPGQTSTDGTSNENTPQDGLTGGAIAGIVIGAILFLILIGFIVLYVLWKKRNVKPLLCLVPIFRKINNLLFKTTLNDTEIEQDKASKEIPAEPIADDSTKPTEALESGDTEDVEPEQNEASEEITAEPMADDDSTKSTDTSEDVDTNDVPQTKPDEE